MLYSGDVVEDWLQNNEIMKNVSGEKREKSMKLNITAKQTPRRFLSQRQKVEKTTHHPTLTPLGRRSRFTFRPPRGKKRNIQDPETAVMTDVKGPSTCSLQTPEFLNLMANGPITTILSSGN